MTVRNGASASVLMYRIGGRSYPLKSAATCLVCRSVHRFDIENEIVAGRVYAQIARSLPESAGINARNIGDHFRNGHMPLEVEESRRVLEHRARERGKDIEAGADSLVDGLVLAEAVVRKGYEALQRGDLQPDMKDVLAAARLLETFGYGEDSGPDQGAIVEAFMVYHETAARYMTPDAFARFGADLSRNPVLRALVARFEDEVVVAEEEEPPEEEEVLGLIDSDDPGEGIVLSVPTDTPPESDHSS